MKISSSSRRPASSYRIDMSAGVVLAAAAGLLQAAVVYADPPNVSDVGYIDGTDLYPTYVSMNGTSVVGTQGIDSGWDAFCWTKSGGVSSLGYLAGGTWSQSNAVTPSGSVVVGIANSSLSAQGAFRWDANNGIQSLGFLPGGQISTANAVSTDGTVIVGGSEIVNHHSRAFRWTSTGGMQNLGVLPGGQDSQAFAVSQDGSIVAGLSDAADGHTHTFLWSHNGMQDLGVVPGGIVLMSGVVNANGSAVWAGFRNYSDSWHAIRWTSWAGVEDLGTLPGDKYSAAYAISADGSVIVGYSETDTATHAMMWTAAIGMLDMNAYLPVLDIDLGDWVLTDVQSVSSDGTCMTGNGLLGGERHTWLLVGLPTDCAADFNSDGFADFFDFNDFVDCFSGGNCPAGKTADFNGDGFADIFDFEEFVEAFENGC